MAKLFFQKFFISKMVTDSFLVEKWAMYKEVPLQK